MSCVSILLTSEMCRYGHLSVCATIVSQLHEHVSSEHLHFWLVTLEEMSLGEASLHGDSPLLDRLGSATSHYCKALAAIKVHHFISVVKLLGVSFLIYNKWSNFPRYE